MEAEPGRGRNPASCSGMGRVRVEALERRNAYVHIPRADRDYAVTVGLRMLSLRHLVTRSEGLYRASGDDLELLAYYANSIEHFRAAQPGTNA